jgi:hypothetical protein
VGQERWSPSSQLYTPSLYLGVVVSLVQGELLECGAGEMESILNRGEGEESCRPRPAIIRKGVILKVDQRCNLSVSSVSSTRLFLLCFICLFTVNTGRFYFTNS